MDTDTDTDTTNAADGEDDPAVANDGAGSLADEAGSPDDEASSLADEAGPPADEIGSPTDEIGPPADEDDDSSPEPTNTTTADEEFVWGVAVGTESGADEAEDAQSDGADSRGPLDPEQYLLAGETLVERHDVRGGWVAVTTHRLLVFDPDPDTDGRRFEAVDRPNVVGVGTTGGGSRTVLSYALQAGGYAVVLLGGGALLRSTGVQSLFSAPETGAQGVDGVLSVLSLVGVVVGLLVDLLFVAGGLAVGLALGLTAWFLRSRAPTLVVERAGDDDIRLRLPATGDATRVVAAVEAALADELAAGPP
jgi:hypothetical protein